MKKTNEPQRPEDEKPILPDAQNNTGKGDDKDAGRDGSRRANRRDGKTEVLPRDTSSTAKRSSDAMTKISMPVKKTDKDAEKPAEPKEPVEEEEPIIVKDRPNSTIFAVAATVLYLLFILIASVAISMFAVDVCKEAFALDKTGVDTEVTLTGDYPTVKDLAEQLYDQHIIKHPTVMTIYAKLRHKDNLNLIPCTRTVTTDMGYDALLELFTPEVAERKTISVTVPEGYTVDDIINLFVSKGVGTRKGFEYVINEAPFDKAPFLYNNETYWFLKELPADGRGEIYRLEGLLYPDTYFVYDTYTDAEGDVPGTAAAKLVVGKMLAEFNKNVKKSFMNKHKAYIAEYYPNVEMSFYDILTLASMLEKEGRPEERARISAVFYNRMNNPAYEDIGGRLESNATVQYELKHLGEKVSLEFGEREKNYLSPYNTYMFEGLPPTPIVTPTRESINAALYPDYTCTSFYFVGTKSGYSFFADTYEEHRQNVINVSNGMEAPPPMEEELPEEEYNE